MRKFILALGILLCLTGFICAGAETLAVSSEGMSLTEALSVAQDGDVIELAEGIYQEPSEVFPLTVIKAVTIRAAAGAQPVIDGPPFVSTFRVETDGVTFSGLDIAFRRHGFYIIGNDVTIENCTIRLADSAWRTSSCGIWLGGVYRAVIRDCDFVSCSIAMAGPPLSERSKAYPVLTGMFEVGEDIKYFTTHTITGCTVNEKQLFYAVNQDQVTAPPDAGQVIIANCGQAIVEDVDVSYGSMGMQIIYCEDVQVTRSKADYCGVFGIYLAKIEQGTVYRSSVEGTNHGIDIRASKNMSTIECEVKNCDQGIFYSVVDYGLVRDCVVTGTGQGYFFAAGNHSQIDGCAAIDCENGFNIQKENDMLITNCTLSGNTICAARLDGSPTFFSNNVLTDNWVAIMAYGEVPFVITDNEVTGSQSCGLYLRDIAYSRISGNKVSGSEGSSVQAIGEMSGTLLVGNAFDKPYEPTKGAVLWDQYNQYSMGE